jgi:alpha-glucosidase
MTLHLAKVYQVGATTPLKWWHNAVIYEVYPRSFQDSDGDGIGDLAGIIQRLDYLADLGVNLLWICPIYTSPMTDYGYDVADYCDIHPMFGDLAAFDRLLAAAHARSLKVVLDLVPNHTSIEHPWFQASRSARDNPKRDWYIWRDAAPDGGPPNNWESIFGGSAWTWDAPTGQYYFHTFLVDQPELNWRNPELVNAMKDVIRFWLDRGIDGFRVDAIVCLMKDAAFRDNPPAGAESFWANWGLTLEPRYTMHQPDTFDQVIDLARIFHEEYEDRVYIGETGAPIFEMLIPYYGKPLGGFDIPFNFSMLYTTWDAAKIRALVEGYYAVIPPGGWPNFVFGNHDDHRLATRYGMENHRSVAMLLLTLWGIPTMYYGDELGMADVFVPVEKRRDPWGINKPESNFGRDPERTPMQWDSSPNAGFTAGEPWLPLADNYETVNVAVQSADPHSTLTFYKRLLHLRRASPALLHGAFAFVDGVPDEVLAYVREAAAERLLILINFGAQVREVDLRSITATANLLLSSHFAEHSGPNVRLQPHESVLLRIAPDAQE